MALIRWDPFHELDRMFDEDWGLVPMTKYVNRTLWSPAIDVSQTDKDVIVEVAIPAGIDPEKVDISIEGDILTARGDTGEIEKEQNEKHYHRREIRRESFERPVMLPAKVKADAAEAVCEKGILKITVPKVKPEQAKKVSVKMKK